MTVRTRFAPSPTGYLHIGGVRTALFCWLFARRMGGQFILRIDDTDQQRNVDEALEPILRGLRWLGIDWDEGPEVGGPNAPYYQSQRAAGHKAAVERLLASGHAYRDYATTEELQAERVEAEREKRVFLYSRKYMAETEADQQRFEAEGRKPVVRLKIPREGTLVIDDLIRGRVEFAWANEQDHVIQRTDGSCLYHLASVVDDNDFGITHVIRAEEHLSNTPRQAFIAMSLGYPLPQYAHLPFVAEPGSKNKLSKRKLDKYLKNKDFAFLVAHGKRILEAIGESRPPELLNPVMVDFYESVGYLPGAILNYLALLGWSLDDKTEDFSREDLIREFTLDRVTKGAASFDPKKLWSFEERHMNAVPPEAKVDLTLPYLQRAKLIGGDVTAEVREATLRVIRAAGERIRVAGDILDFAEFFLDDGQLPYDEKAVAKCLYKAGAAELLGKLRSRLAAAEVFEPETLEKLLQDFVAAEEIKIGDIIHPLRVALTGKSIGAGLYDTLSILGKDRCLRRIDRAMAMTVN